MIKSALQSSLTNDVKYTSMSVGNLPSSEYLITSTVLTQAEPSITFDLTGLSNIYQHLQLVFVVRNSSGGTGNAETRLRLNGDTASNYAWHHLRGDGNSATSTAGTSADHMRVGLHPYNGATSEVFSSGVIEILDAFKTTKNKTVRTLVGHIQPNGSSVFLSSGFRNNTAALTSITLYPEANNWRIGSRFSLYGVV